MIPFSGTPTNWNELIVHLPCAHLLQTAEWSQVKARYGWKPLPFVWQEQEGRTIAAAMILKRSLPIGGFSKKISVLYIPKGPLMDWGDSPLRRRVLSDIGNFASSRVPYL